jgi:hypothetical protein
VVVAWLLFPLVMLVVCLGCGLAVERAAGWQLPGGVLLSLGLALIIVASTLTTESTTTAPWTLPVVLLLSVAGLIAGWPRLRALRPDPWMAGLAVAVFVIYAAPVVASGNASWLGFSIDGDPAIHFLLVSHLLAHGHAYPGPGEFPNTSGALFVRSYLGTSYPVGADLPVGLLRSLVGQDLAWVYQPYLAVMMSMAALGLYELLDGTVGSRALRSFTALIVSLAGLTYAFYLVASVKELATTWVVTVTVVLVFATLRRPPGLRALVPLVVAAVAGLDILAVAIAPWLGVPLAVFVVASGWRLRGVPRRRPTGRQIAMLAGGVVVVVAVVAPVLSGALTFVNAANGALTSQGTLGDLLAPLKARQILGIWPTSDFRQPIVVDHTLVYALIDLAALSAVAGVLWMAWRRAYPLLLLVIGDALAAAVLLGRSSPYAASKVYMIVSTAAVMAAMTGSVALHRSGRRIAGWALAGVIGAGVLWTTVVAYHNAKPAPRARLAELAAIDTRFSGTGPTFYNLWDYEFPTYFLRNVGAEVNEFFSFAAQRQGTPARSAAQVEVPWDPNDLAEPYVQSFRLLVLGRSPILSRPPANFRLATQTRSYDVWRRTGSPTVLAHVAISGGLDPAGPPRCQQIRSLGDRAAAEHATLDVVPRPALPTFDPIRSVHPSGWIANVGDESSTPDLLQLDSQPGTVNGLINVPAAGRYQVWLEGSLTQRVSVSVGLHPVGSVANDAGPPGLFRQVGTVSLPAGRQPVILTRSGAGLGPVNQIPPTDALGPLILVPGSEISPIEQVSPAAASSLCGRSLEWIEIVR